VRSAGRKCKKQSPSEGSDCWPVNAGLLPEIRNPHSPFRTIKIASNPGCVHESHPIAAMNNPARLFLALLTLCALAVAGRAQATATKPGYSVVVEISYDEAGKPESGKIVRSDDPTGDHTLEQVALRMAQQDPQPPRLADGKPVKFKARRPFNFPVEGDQGEAANANRPVLRAGNQVIPKYPDSAPAEVLTGGAIIALVIRADGTVASSQVVAASHAAFAEAAESALKQWVFNPREGPGMPAQSTWHAAVSFSREGQVPDLKWRLAPRPSIGSFTVGRLPTAAAAAPATTPEAPAVSVPAKP
jgi:TonB family protein